MGFEALDGHPFPLLKGGGLILMGAGIGVLLASLWRDYFLPLFFLGFGGGFAALYALNLTVPFDQVPPLQVIGFFGAIVFEVLAITYLVLRGPSDERRFILSIFMVIALHFVVMSISHGPVMLAAAVGMSLAASLGLAVRSLPIAFVMASDGAIKLAAGAVMTQDNPAWRWADAARLAS